MSTKCGLARSEDVYLYRDARELGVADRLYLRLRRCRGVSVTADDGEHTMVIPVLTTEQARQLRDVLNEANLGDD